MKQLLDVAGDRSLRIVDVQAFRTGRPRADCAGLRCLIGFSTTLSAVFSLAGSINGAGLVWRWSIVAELTGRAQAPDEAGSVVWKTSPVSA
jgi:hypothetical protein